MSSVTRPSATITTLEKKLAKNVGRCIQEHGLIEEGDRIMVCLSGGKDSYTLLHLLERARKRAPIEFSLIAVHLDQGQPDYDNTALKAWLEQNQYDHRIEREDTYAIVKEKIPEGKTYCSLCSRLRRGVLYNLAEKLGCTKIALGHHQDDTIETLMLNLLFNGSLGGMPAKWQTKDGRNTVIRPLLYCLEKDIAAFSEHMQFPILPCNLCGSQENLMRQQIKALLGDLEHKNPDVRHSMLAAMTHVKSTHLLDASLSQNTHASEEPIDPITLRMPNKNLQRQRQSSASIKLPLIS